MKNFAVIGCGGYIAPRHLKAIKETGNTVVAALDKSDSVGILDEYFENAHFFTEFERFDRFAEKIRAGSKKRKINYVSICSPNYLHDAHIRFAFRIGANAICEKPLVSSPWNLDSLERLEKNSGRKVFGILQLRLHPSIIELKKKIESENSGKKHEIELTYITRRGKWYQQSWKGDERKSGGIIQNLGIHFFDMLIWIFGDVKKNEVYQRNDQKASGFLELDKARVKWFLSIDKKDLPREKDNSPLRAYRSIKVDGKEIEFSNVFADLHTESYKQILAGNGFGIGDARASIEVTHKLKTAKVQKGLKENLHPKLISAKNDRTANTQNGNSRRR